METKHGTPRLSLTSSSTQNQVWVKGTDDKVPADVTLLSLIPSLGVMPSLYTSYVATQSVNPVNDLPYISLRLRLALLLYLITLLPTGIKDFTTKPYRYKLYKVGYN
ncbi:uncharacterized protein LY79DRAFT_580287 [Colletotrichum navitas]|uniref:Uncharacterized protein n=1 Tax=Colletotrichum navitas TaxID=681940 RepID=A0AAD8PZR2_9PEZI|nr:uncharacterized protein LY79DRAFT_580287 [Colletotrichum navitas]KAK1590112.1 hypothetical protein LY79DRAFT_580287 [Colletotrichum navitas]